MSPARSGAAAPGCVPVHSPLQQHRMLSIFSGSVWTLVPFAPSRYNSFGDVTWAREQRHDWRDQLSVNSRSQGAVVFASHVQSCRSAAAPGAPTALTELGQCCSSRLRLCQEIGFLGTCSESNLNVFRSHNPRPAPENLTRGFESNGLGLTDALSDNFSSSEAAGLGNHERKAQQKPLGGRTCP